jgi:sulfite exporter TauE/SafE
MDEQTLLIKMLESGWAQCAAVVRDDAGVLVTALVAGLIGGLTHCAGMCGPFVLSQVTARMEAVPVQKMSELTRLSGALLVPYHLGRGTIYIFLGLLAGLFADGLSALVETWWLTPLLLSLAAVFFLTYGLAGLVPHLGSGGGSKAAAWWNRVLGKPLRPLFAAPIGWRGYGLGLALGLLPCGLVYGALLMAGGTGEPLAGAMTMGAFLLGTVPALVAVGVAGQLAARQFRELMGPVGRGVMVLNAGVLAFLAYGHIS